MIAADLSALIPYGEPIAMVATGAGAFVASSMTDKRLARLAASALGAALMAYAGVLLFVYSPACEQLEPWSWMWIASGCWFLN